MFEGNLVKFLRLKGYVGCSLRKDEVFTAPKCFKAQVYESKLSVWRNKRVKSK